MGLFLSILYTGRLNPQNTYLNLLYCKVTSQREITSILPAGLECHTIGFLFSFRVSLTPGGGGVFFFFPLLTSHCWLLVHLVIKHFHGNSRRNHGQGADWSQTQFDRCLTDTHSDANSTGRLYTSVEGGVCDRYNTAFIFLSPFFVYLPCFKPSWNYKLCLFLLAFRLMIYKQAICSSICELSIWFLVSMRYDSKCWSWRNFRACSQICEKRLLASSCLSVCPSIRPHGTTRLASDGFSSNLILFSKICRENSTFIKIWQE